ncbi:hypothetical protein SDC9_165622 [bioreactor metagenome]|uniref:Uncharacterized protein n=1 Tax=bioreactor metagenome TaxID=1076179 RepID=A0A645FX24_9ZZZZ
MLVYLSMGMKIAVYLCIAFSAIVVAIAANILLFFIKPESSIGAKIMFNLMPAILFFLSLSLPLILLVNHIGENDRNSEQPKSGERR